MALFLPFCLNWKEIEDILTEKDKLATLSLGCLYSINKSTTRATASADNTAEKIGVSDTNDTNANVSRAVKTAITNGVLRETSKIIDDWTKVNEII